MPFEMYDAKVEDILRMVEIRFMNAQNDPYERIMFPKKITPESRTATIQRFRSALVDDPHCNVLKIMDNKTQDIVAFAIWVIYEEATPEAISLEWERDWDEGTNQEAGDELVTAIMTRKQQLIAGTAHCYLDLLEVDPKWQRQGAGKMLLHWGLDRADALRLPCYLESTPAGLPLYKSRRFEEVDVIDLDMSKWGIEGISRYMCLLRRPPSLGPKDRVDKTPVAS